jgi:hypothetical protein
MKTTHWTSLLTCSVLLLAPATVRAQSPPPNGPTNLASWSFGTSDLANDQSSFPVFRTNVSLSVMGDGQTVVLDSTNGTPAGLCYAIVDGDQTNVATTGAGAISLWVASSSWASTNTPSGTGPGQVVPLFEVGGCVPGTSGGGFGLFLDESGCWLRLKSRDSAGDESTLLSAPISFATNSFHCFTVCYSPSNSFLYAGGLLLTNGAGLTGQDWPVATANGFWVGSGPDGVQSRCLIDDVFTFDYALSGAEAQWLYDSFFIAYYVNPENPANCSSLLTSAPFYTTNEAGNFKAMAGPGALARTGTDPNWSPSDTVRLANVTAQAGIGGATVLSFTLAGGSADNGALYDVLATAALSSPLTNSQFVWLGRAAAGGRYSVSVGSTRAFVLLAAPLDPDFDGIFSGTEILALHMDPNNGDQNENSLLDGWEWAFFGNLDQTGWGDFDSDGVSNYDEWFYQRDPNKVRFTVSVTNQIVSTPVVPLHLEILGGVPSKMALLVDTTNSEAAAWMPYSANLVANLGTSQGWHDVWVLAHGRPENSYQSQGYVRVKLDSTPPLLVITNPASQSVAQGLVQVQGYANEALASLTYDLSNTNGTLTGQQSVIIGQFYSTNTAEFTTNFFQCYDVLLAGGTNTLTLHATDWAGNMASISTNIVYWPSTNAPAVSLLWPQDGMQISGANITINGQVDDPTATVSVSVTDTNGSTASFNGLVGRDGVFWIENVSLNPSTNFLVLSLSGAEGVTTTSLTLHQSSVGFTVYPVQAGETTVSGTIDTDDYMIWVNGTNAIPANGAWSAQIAPVPYTGGLLQVIAIPSSDNGGYGSGATNGHNPQSAQGINAPATVPPAQGVYVASYHLNDQVDYTFFDACSNGVWYSEHLYEVMSWQDGQGGSRDRLRYVYSNPECPQMFRTDWPESGWPQALPSGTELVTWWHTVPGSTNELLCAATNVVGPYSFPLEHCDISQPYYNVFSRERRTADTELKLATGGPLGSTQRNLWVISAILTDADTGEPIPPEQISIGDLGNPDTNGNLYVVLPDNDPRNVTPRAPWKKWNGLVTATKYPAGIVANGLALSDKYTRDFCVGQGIYFNIVMDHPLGDPTETVAEWTLPGAYVNRQPDPTCLAYFDIDTNLLTRSSLHGGTTTTAWFMDELHAATVSATVRHHFGNNPKWFTNTLTGKINVHKPTTTFIPPTALHGTPTVRVAGAYLSLGWNGALDMSFGHQILSTNFSGQAGYTQLARGEYTDSGTGLPIAISTSGLALDTAEFYRGLNSISANTSTNISFSDGPRVGLYYATGGAKMDAEFSTYLLFKPDMRPNDQGPNIFVPLELVRWELHDEAANNAVVTGEVNGPTNNIATEFPHWRSVFTP